LYKPYVTDISINIRIPPSKGEPGGGGGVEGGGGPGAAKT